MSDRYEGRQGTFALHFFAAAVAAGGLVGLLAAVLSVGLPGPEPLDRLRIPPAFWVSSLLLAAGSLQMHRSLEAARAERQRQFRRGMVTALVIGTLFVGTQCHALACLASFADVRNASANASGFVLVFAILHGIHFIVALLFLVFVTLRALADRYDHEYYFGVWVCAWFWHVLGIVWMPILGILLVARGQ